MTTPAGSGSRTEPRRTLRFLRNTTAGPIVEFAIIVPVLVLLFLGIIGLSFGHVQRNNMVAAVREGARKAAVMPQNPCDVEDWSEIKQVVRDYFVAVSDQVVIDSVDVAPDGCDPGEEETIVVRIIDQPYNAPLFALLPRGAITLQAKATYRWERSE